jgi:hypothetical protein
MQEKAIYFRELEQGEGGPTKGGRSQMPFGHKLSRLGAGALRAKKLEILELTLESKGGDNGQAREFGAITLEQLIFSIVLVVER